MSESEDEKNTHIATTQQTLESLNGSFNESNRQYTSHNERELRSTKEYEINNNINSANKKEDSIEDKEEHHGKERDHTETDEEEDEWEERREDDEDHSDEIMIRFDGMPKFVKKRNLRQKIKRAAQNAKSWCYGKLNTRPLINLVFQAMELLTIVAGFACIRLTAISILPAFFSLLLIAVIVAKNMCKHNHNGLCYQLCYATELFIMLLGVPVFFFSIQKAVRSDKLYDSAFVEVDAWLLGWAFPDGQLALWADSTRWIHPETVLGKLLTELLAIVYFGYYAYLYIVPLCLGLKFFWYLHQVYDRHAARHRQIAHTIQEAKHFVVAFTLCYTLTMALNAALPGKSPRIYLKERYVHKLSGVALAKGLSTLSQDDTTAATFPSGHVALTTTTTVMLFFVWYPYVETPLLVCIAVPVLMSLATLYLRYHYAVDVVVGLWIAAVSCAASILTRRRNGDNGVRFERISMRPPRKTAAALSHSREKGLKTNADQANLNPIVGS